MRYIPVNKLGRPQQAAWLPFPESRGFASSSRGALSLSNLHPLSWYQNDFILLGPQEWLSSCQVFPLRMVLLPRVGPNYTLNRTVLSLYEVCFLHLRKQPLPLDAEIHSVPLPFLKQEFLGFLILSYSLLVGYVSGL